MSKGCTQDPAQNSNTQTCHQGASYKSKSAHHFVSVLKLKQTCKENLLDNKGQNLLCVC